MNIQEYYTPIRKYLTIASFVGELPTNIVDEVMNILEDKEVEYLSRNEAANFLHCTVQHLDRLTREGKIEKKWLSEGKPCFIKSDLIKYINHHTKNLSNTLVAKVG